MVIIWREEADKEFYAGRIYRREAMDERRKVTFGWRPKEQINRAGENIMPSEIEAYLCRHSKIVRGSRCRRSG